MTAIRISPDHIWEFYIENRTSISESYVEIAADDELGLSICITEEGYVPTLLVEFDGEVDMEISCMSKSELEDQYIQLLEMFSGDDEEEEEPDPDKEYPDSFDAAEALLCAIQDECNVDLHINEELVWGFLQTAVSALSMAIRP